MSVFAVKLLRFKIKLIGSAGWSPLNENCMLIAPNSADYLRGAWVGTMGVGRT